MTARGALRARLLGEANWPSLSRAFVATLPSIALLVLTGDHRWLATAAFVSICAAIVEERLALTLQGVLLHGAAIMLGFTIFVAVASRSGLFVALCACMAGASVCLTARGKHLRSLGNFTFLPSLYLANEALEHAAAQGLAVHPVSEAFYIAAGLMPVAALALGRQLASRPTPASSPRRQLALIRLSRTSDYGERRSVIGTCLTIVCSVALAAILVKWRSFGHGQWVIWSSASVVTGKIETARTKMHARTVGAAVGVPIGVLVGLALPRSAMVCDASLIAGLFTLVAFRRYIIGFGMRCAFIAVALTAGGNSTLASGERILDVLLGGMIGWTCVLVARSISQWTSGHVAGVAPGVSREPGSGCDKGYAAVSVVVLRASPPTNSHRKCGERHGRDRVDG
ncbi:FUSC family protein [Pandoraea sputorum]|uniref:Integral membrane bound transporter domain-containing protein n=1 Tax=Pandoraea sputorum TaxID=93222 RepID=A0A5E5AUD2_9BURK|nr:FUSC family protein [Pandoraea sputorum]VVE75710.1 hypothetical protein PSP31121_00579 [Pandoraea sputorum]